MLSKIEKKEFLDFSIAMAFEAGEILKKYQKKISKLKIHSKEGEGVASEADLKSEKFITKEIKRSFPEHMVLAEEDSFGKKLSRESKKDFCLSNEFTWVIDPLDGTTNFLGGFDYYSVCISLTYFGRPFLGVVYRPSLGECFFSLKGQGARKGILDKGLLRKGSVKKIYQKDNKRRPKDSIFVTGFASEKRGRVRAEFDQFQKVMENSRGIRRLGSAALDMCYVAEGIFDGYWERGLSPWDVAAPSVICLEAGVKLSDYKGRKFDIFDNNILVSRPPLHGKLKSLLN